MCKSSYKSTCAFSPWSSTFSSLKPVFSFVAHKDQQQTSLESDLIASLLTDQMLSRRKWQEELELTRSASILREGSLDEFPLAKIQALTDRHLLLSWSDTPIQPCSSEADDVITLELAKVKGRLRHYETGLLATLHALSPSEARTRLHELKPKLEFPNEHFIDIVAIYLQCLIIAHKARELTCNETECCAAWELFILVKRGKRDDFANMPTIWRTLRASTDGFLDDVLPLELITEIVKRSSYAKRFRAEVNRLHQSCEWSRLYDLVAGAADLVDFPDILALVLPPGDFASILTWRPNIRRIMFWGSKIDGSREYNVASILRLEGPDTTGLQRATLRDSCAGEFVQLGMAPPHEGSQLLERLLDAFDKALLAGPAYIQDLVSTCAAEPRRKTFAMLNNAVNAWEHVRRPGPQEKGAGTRVEDGQSWPNRRISPPPAALNQWLERPLEHDRGVLRDKLQHMIKKVPLSLLTECIEQSVQSHVHDEFIQNLNNLLMDDNDQVCVNVANFLGPRTKNDKFNRMDGCWARLLMHMMQQQELGMMNRCGERLLRETWLSWVENLGILYGEEHFSEEAGLGFTKEGFNKWMLKKSKPVRVKSSVSAMENRRGASLASRDAAMPRSLSTATGRGR